MEIYDYGWTQWLAIIIMISFCFGAWSKVDIGYGKHINSLLKITIAPRLGWFIFEVPNLIMASYFFSTNQINWFCTDSLALMLFVIHYINRDLIYPFRISSITKRLPLEVVASAVLYTTCNGYLQSSTHLIKQSDHQITILSIIGVAIFAVGMYLNIQCDNHLRKLKDQNKGEYGIPNAGLYQYVSSAHYTSETFEWLGYSIVSGRFSSLLFVVLTLAILSARALKTHQWYLDKFPQFPKGRKSMIPFMY